jgi:two-component system OmpR family sensor kinase
MAQCVAAALTQAQARKVDLGVADSTAATVRADPAALRVMLGNLIDNAVKYAPEGGRVDVSLRVEQGVPVLSVEDNGPGIPPAERERAFDRFYRVPGSGGEGSGLGLAIVQTIAQQQGASVHLGESESLGGLKVTVRLPANNTSAAKNAQKASAD